MFVQIVVHDKEIITNNNHLIQIIVKKLIPKFANKKTILVIEVDRRVKCERPINVATLRIDSQKRVTLGQGKVCEIGS